jgi:hypothetical protein
MQLSTPLSRASLAPRIFAALSHALVSLSGEHHNHGHMITPRRVTQYERDVVDDGGCEKTYIADSSERKEFVILK